MAQSGSAVAGHDDDDDQQQQPSSSDQIELGSLNRLIDDEPPDRSDDVKQPQASEVKQPRCFLYHQWICCACVWLLGLSWKAKLATFLVVAAIIIMIVLSFDGNSCIHVPITIEPLPDPSYLLPSGHRPPSATAKRNREFILTLLGDSLIIDPEWKYNFNHKIQTFLGDYNVQVYNHGRRAERMNDILTDARKVVYNYTAGKGHDEGWATRRPDGIIIMSTSDVVTGGMAQSVPWAFGSPEYYAHQATYTIQVRVRRTDSQTVSQTSRLADWQPARQPDS